jgi:hypothetical protein
VSLRTKLVAEQVHEIRRLLACGLLDSQVARQFNVDHSTIRAIREGRTWTGKPKRQPEPRKVNCKWCGVEIMRRVAKAAATCRTPACRYKAERETLDNGRRFRILRTALGFTDFDAYLKNVRVGTSASGCKDCACISVKQAEACLCTCHGVFE